MKKILIVITKGEVGGAQMSVLNLAKGLQDKGLEVKVGFGEGDFLKNELGKYNIPYTNFKHLKRTHNPFANLFFIKEIRKFLNKEKFDVVHINSSNALFAAPGAKLSKFKPKTVFTFRGMSILDENYRKNKLLKFFYKIFFKLFLKFVDKPVFVSKQNLEKGKKEKLIKKGYLVYNGLDPKRLDFYSKEEGVKRLEEKISKELKNYFIIGSIGRLSYQKNYEFLINIFPEILEIKSNAVAIIIGDGPEKDEYQKLIRQKKLENKIFLAGSIDNASGFLNIFDLFVLPSRYEGLSITLIEAVFARVPILASAVGGNTENLASSQSLYQLDDKKDFLDKFRMFLNEDKKNKSVEDNSMNGKRFLLKNTVESYFKIYKS